jgi:hypothetical protein
LCVRTGENDRLHIHPSEVDLVSRQALTGQKLEDIDGWRHGLTVSAIVYGLAVGAGYIYKNWFAASNGLVR